jgi:hypothetical protein
VIHSPDSLEERLALIRGAMVETCRRAGRDAADVTLVAITKGVAPGLVSWAARAGIRDFGENYVKDLAEKRTMVGDEEPRHSRPRWHYVGTLQSHTAHRVADLADVVHTLVPGRAAGRLASRATRRRERLPTLIQVDFTGSRTGAAPEEVPAFAEEAARLEGIELTGLMTLPPMPERAEDSRPYFRRLRELRDLLRERDPAIRELSMGMSADYEVAIEEGSTMVRIGTALFGERTEAPAT